MLSELKIINFRNIKEACLIFPGKITFLFGDNGSGKTSILESIYYLAFGRSFRAPGFKRLINFYADSFIVSANILSFYDNNKFSRESRLGLEKFRSGESRLKLNNEKASSFVDFARYLPVQILNGSSYLILEGEPIFRRRFLDWGLFHVEHTFIGVWKQYQKLLQHRNALIKSSDFNNSNRRLMHVWQQQFIDLGNKLNNFRADFVWMLEKKLIEIVRHIKLFKNFKFSIKYKTGWKSEKNLQEALDLSWEQDLKLKTSTQGPHRADFLIEVNDKPAKYFLSRGQTKLLVFALNLAISSLLQEKNSNFNSIFLIDDLRSELDNKSVDIILDYLHQAKNQAIITGIDRFSVHDIDKYNAAMFHVEHGVLI